MKRIYLALAIVLFALFTSVVALAADAQLVFVVSKDQAHTKIDAAQVRNIYLGKSSFWPDGTPINAYARPLDAPAGIAFLKQVVRMTPVRFKHHWAGLKLSGQAMDLSMVGDPAQLGARVASNKGAIGYVLSSETHALDKNQVHLITLAL